MISKKNILELEPRQIIYSHISKNPGTHLRETQRKTNIPYTTLKHHLKYLEKQSLISTKKVNSYRRYYASNKLGQKEKNILNLFRQEVPRRILVYLLFFHVFSQSELSKDLEKKPPTIDFHLRKLKKLGLIEELPKNSTFDDEGWGIKIKRSRISNEKLYAASSYDIVYTIYDMLIMYKDSLPKDNLVQTFLKDLNLDLVKEPRNRTARRFPKFVYKKLNNPDVAIDQVIELLYEVCPHPYHV